MFNLNTNSTKKEKNKISNAFSDEKLFYNQIEIFNFYIKSLPLFEKEFKIGTSKVEYDYDEDDDIITTIAGQEVYLGYSPKTDTFFAGYDLWASGVYSGTIEFSIKDKSIEIVDIKQFENAFYNTSYKELKKLNQEIIDIRLD